MPFCKKIVSIGTSVCGHASFHIRLTLLLQQNIKYIQVTRQYYQVKGAESGD